MDKPITVGVMGGTFDPIHYGHLVAAENARCSFELDKVLLIPAARPPHKDEKGVTNEQHRMRMVELAVADNVHFEASAMELRREGPSYTIDTVQSIQAAYPGSKIYFIMGLDALLLIKTWKEYKELIALCSFIAVTRPGYSLKDHNSDLAELPEEFWRKIKCLEIPALDISSQMLRQRVAQRRSIKYLLPAAVENYIHDNDLYNQGVK